MMRIRPLVQLGRLDDAEAALVDVLEMIGPADLRMRAWHLQMHAEVARWRGDDPRAADYGDRAADLLADTGHSVEWRIASEFAAACNARAGRFGAAAVRLRQAAALPPSGGHLRGYRVLAESALAAARGLGTDAEMILRAGADIAHADGAPIEGLELLFEAACLTGRTIEHPAAYGPATGGPLTGPLADVVRCGPHTARSAGGALLRLGAVGPARRLGAAPQECAGVRALTARERHIAELVSAGHGSRDIAAMLGISPRTVDNHLQRVYDKLHVRSRQELAGGLKALLRPTGRATR